MTITRQDVAAEAWSWMGTPFQHQACLRHIACDCIGLVAGVGLALGMAQAEAWLVDPEFRGYSRLPNVEKLKAGAGKYMDTIAIADAGVGDILLMSFFEQPMHFAIICQTKPRPIMVHAYSIVGCVCANGIDDKWQRRTVGAYRYRGLEV